MKRLFSYILLFILPFVSLAQESGEISITVNLEGNQEPLTLFQFNGFNLKPVHTQEPQEDGSVIFNLPKTEPMFFYLGNQPNKIMPFIGGSEDSLLLKGNVKNIPGVKVVGSPINQEYSSMLNGMGSEKQESGKLLRLYVQTNNLNKDSLKTAMQVIDQKMLDRLAKLKDSNPFLARIAGINTYLSWPNQEEKYPRELDYFANEFFAHADLNDPGYAFSPWIYQSFSQYTTTLIRARLTEESLQTVLENQLGRAKDNTNNHQMAYGGILAGLRQTKNGQFNHFAEQFIEQHGEALPEVTQQLTAEINNNKMLSVGSEAPNFTQATPEGADLSLNELRGKVVLIDFWASWCGPCRRENPNVVRMYEKFKDKGFEILGVSLDNNKARWLDAIEKDQLTWLHVSDLGGWGNSVARQYKVDGIPDTFLLDRDGKIIARNLRGTTLERKLEEIFGAP